jgi:hypothetical protein
MIYLPLLKFIKKNKETQSSKRKIIKSRWVEKQYAKLDVDIVLPFSRIFYLEYHQYLTGDFEDEIIVSLDGTVNYS